MDDFFDIEPVVTIDNDVYIKATRKDIIGYLTYNKKPWLELTGAEKSLVNVFYLNEYFAHKEALTFAIAQMQHLLLEMPKEYVYKFYYDLLPKADLNIKFEYGDDVSLRDRIGELIAERLDISKREGIYFYVNHFIKKGHLGDVIDIIVTSALTDKEENKLVRYVQRELPY